MNRMSLSQKLAKAMYKHGAKSVSVEEIFYGEPYYFILDSAYTEWGKGGVLLNKYHCYNPKLSKKSLVFINDNDWTTQSTADGMIKNLLEDFNDFDDYLEYDSVSECFIHHHYNDNGDDETYRLYIGRGVIR